MKLKTVLFITIFTLATSITSFAKATNTGINLSSYWSQNSVFPVIQEQKSDTNLYSSTPTQQTSQISITDGIYFSKTAHRVDLYQNGQVIKSYAAASGMTAGDKEREGDCKTPEGTFYIAKKIPNSQYVLGLLISYPSIEDAARGINTGLINASQYNSIVNAINAGAIPPQSTNLGGLIEFHGCDDVLNDATHGCIILSRADIIDLYNRASVGMKVVITA